MTPTPKLFLPTYDFYTENRGDYDNLMDRIAKKRFDQIGAEDAETFSNFEVFTSSASQSWLSSEELYIAQERSDLFRSEFKNNNASFRSIIAGEDLFYSFLGYATMRSQSFNLQHRQENDLVVSLEKGAGEMSTVAIFENFVWKYAVLALSEVANKNLFNTQESNQIFLRIFRALEYVSMLKVVNSIGSELLDDDIKESFRSQQSSFRRFGDFIAETIKNRD